MSEMPVVGGILLPIPAKGPQQCTPQRANRTSATGIHREKLAHKKPQPPGDGGLHRRDCLMCHFQSLLGVVDSLVGPVQLGVKLLGLGLELLTSFRRDPE